MCDVNRIKITILNKQRMAVTESNHRTITATQTLIEKNLRKSSPIHKNQKLGSIMLSATDELRAFSFLYPRNRRSTPRRLGYRAVPLW